MVQYRKRKRDLKRRCFQCRNDQNCELTAVRSGDWKLHTQNGKPVSLFNLVLLLAVFISDLEIQSLASKQTITTLFGFTNAEYELAQRLSQGMTLALAADELCISQHTARAQLKSVFAKAGVTRQADLVRLLIKSAATLA